MNLFCNSVFRGNRINLAHRWRDSAGNLLANHPERGHGASGKFGVFNSRMIGTKEMDFDFGSGKMRYFLGVESDSQVIGESVGRRGWDIQLFENCTFDATAPVFYRGDRSGGPIFLYSKIHTDGIEVDMVGDGAGFAINLWSELGEAEWETPARRFLP